MKKMAFLLVLGCAAWAAQEQGEAKHEAATHEAQGHESGGHEAGDPNLAAKWVNFAILAGALAYLAIKLGGPALRSQQKAILENMAEASKRAEAALAQAAEIDRRVSRMGDEVAAMRQKASQELAAEAERLEHETAQALAKLEQAGEQEIASASKFAQAELKATAAKLALELAQQKVRARMTPDAQGALVERFVAGLTSQREGRE